MSKIDFEVGEVGVLSINQFALSVPDIDEEAKFLTAFGLGVTRSQGILEIRASESDHVWAVILKGEKKRLTFISLGCYQEDFEKIRLQVIAARGVFCAGHPNGPAGGFWFRDPDNNLIQVVVAPKTQPDSKSLMADMNIPPNVRGAPARSAAKKVAPTRLSHMALFTSNVTNSLAFYTKALGLQLADRSGDIIAFTYGRHGSDHHLLAFLIGGGGGLHHSSWDMPNVEALGLGNTQMRVAGYDRHWGPGRHVLGSNYYNYVKDPFGQWWEYSSHIDYIEKNADWTIANFSDEDALYLWGPDLPADFADNIEIDA